MRSWLAALAACVALAVPTTRPAAATSPTRLPNSCPEVFFVAARGSDQSDTTDLGIGPEMVRLFRAYRAALVEADRRTTDTNRPIVTVASAVDYPAVDAPWPLGSSTTAQYARSVERGVRSVLQHIDVLSNRCGATTRFVLAGYSQGAHVIRRSLDRLANSRRADVLAVVLVSDPQCSGPQPGVRHIGVQRCRGILGTRAVPTWAARRTTQVCFSPDLVCGQPRNGTPRYRADDMAAPAGFAVTKTPAAGGVPTCDGFVATHVGGPGSDVLRGSSANDVIVGRAGSDTLDGRAGDDRLCGDGGDDVLIAGQGNNALRGGSGTDDCFGLAWANSFVGCERLGAAAPWSPRSVAIIGDSVPASALEGFRAEAASRGVDLVSYVVPGCGIAIGPVADDDGNLIPWTPACATVIGPGLAEFIADHDPDAVIWWSGWETADRIVDGTVAPAGSARWRADLDAMLEERLRSVTSFGARVVLVDTTPNAASPAGPADLDEDGRVAALRTRLHALAARHPDDAAVVEFSLVLCPTGVPCPSDVDGVIVRPNDGGHFTNATAPWVAERLWPLVAARWERFER